MKEFHKLLESLGGNEIAPRRFFILNKAGQPLLYLPKDRRLADAVLRLYPAQTFLARGLVRGIREFARRGWLLASKRLSLEVSPNSALGVFFKQLVPDGADVPLFGVLGGNSKVPGRRFTFLLFDREQKPVIVVKVGLNERARRLIQVEQDFFFPQSPDEPGMPRALAMHRGQDFSAIAYGYVEGVSPGHHEERGIELLLNSWISKSEPVPIRNLSIWPELEALGRDSPELGPIFHILENVPVRPVLFHGDFTPWNVRVSPSNKDEWVALDWERSRIGGMPGWDWFHYLVQYNTMVRRTTVETTLSDLEALWGSAAFLGYARRVGIEKIFKELTLVYLLHLLHYAAPHDKTAQIYALTEKFRARYFGDLKPSPSTLKISVVTPSYKQLPWLKLCLASVADQKDVKVEHIVQDAQSGPEVEEWVRNHSKARLYVEADSGMYDAINRGFARATGDIVCWLNSDEQYLEGALAKVAHFFSIHPEVDVLFGDALLISNTGSLLSYRKTIFPNADHIQMAHLNVLSCATFVRRSVLDQAYLLDTRWRAIADAVWVVAMLKGGISMAVLNEPLAVFTITDKNLGQSSLAMTETERWQQETSSRLLWFKTFFILRHRLSKLIKGAYWPRSINTRFYVLGNTEERITRAVPLLGFKWPNKI